MSGLGLKQGKTQSLLIFQDQAKLMEQIIEWSLARIKVTLRFFVLSFVPTLMSFR